MATLVLAAAGSAVGSAVGGSFLGVSAQLLGGFLGGVIGGEIDNALFGGGRTVEGPRLSDLAVQSSTYGLPLPLAYGQVRIAGNIFWSAGLKETRSEDSTSVGGKGGGGSVTQVTYSYSASFAVGLSARRIADIGRIWADGKLLRDAAGNFSVGGSLRIYKGTEDQLPDPLMEATEGLGNVSAHRGLAYVVFEDLQLGEFANRIPNLTFEVIADSGGDVALGTIIQDLAVRVGMTAVDVSDIDQSVDGFVLARDMAMRDAMEALARVYDFDITERDRDLVARRRPRQTVRTIEKDDMGAGYAAPERRRGQELDLPREVSVRYIDPARDYQTNLQRARRMVTESAGTRVIDVPAVLSATAAKRTAERHLSRAWAERDRFHFPLLPKYVGLTPGDVVEVPDGAVRHVLRIEKTTLAGALLCEAAMERPSVYDSDAVGDGGQFVPPEIAPQGETTLVLVNLPSVTANDATLPTYYAAAAGVARGWRGTVVYRSTDGGQAYERLAVGTVAATIGTAAEALPAGPSAFWDEENRVTIRLLRDDMALESRDSHAVLGGANAALLGAELLQFREAVLEADGSYTLRGLLRGRRGTEAAIGQHSAGETFVLLDAGTLYAVPSQLGEVGKSYLFKPVTMNATLAETAAQSFAYSGRNLRPLSPVHARGERDASGSLSISWTRRSRVGGEWLDGIDVPLGEENERYEIDIMAGDSVVRTLTAETPSAIYTAAQQEADFGTVLSSCDLRIFQISAVVGRGSVLAATL